MILSAYDFCLLPLALSAWAALSASATRGAASENSASRELRAHRGALVWLTEIDGGIFVYLLG